MKALSRISQISLLVFLLFSCQTDEINKPSLEEFVISENDSPKYLGELEIPIGTKVIKDRNRMDLIFPKSVLLVSIDKEDGVITTFSRTSIVCTVKSGCTDGGCEPSFIEAGGILVCSSCSPPSGGKCLTSTPSGNPEQKIGLTGTVDLDAIRNPYAFLDMRKKINIIDGNIPGDLQPLSDILFQIPEVSESFIKHVKNLGFPDFEFDNINQQPEKLGLAPVNIFGFVGLMVVPKEISKLPLYDDLDADPNRESSFKF